MLVIERKIRESIYLKVGDITVKISPLRITAGEVRKVAIGIAAPLEVQVLRSELVDVGNGDTDCFVADGNW